MANKLQANQISTSSSSWYYRLRALQGKYGITKTSDAGITAGARATYSQYNTFINALNGLQSNTFLAYAQWSSYKPTTVSSGTKITESSQKTKIENMLTSLEAVNANYINYSERTVTECTDDTDCIAYGDNSDWTDNSADAREHDYTTNTDGCIVNYVCEDYGDNGVDGHNDTADWCGVCTDNCGGCPEIDCDCTDDGTYFDYGDDSYNGHEGVYDVDADNGDCGDYDDCNDDMCPVDVLECGKECEDCENCSDDSYNGDDTDNYVDSDITYGVAP